MCVTILTQIFDQNFHFLTKIKNFSKIPNKFPIIVDFRPTFRLLATLGGLDSPNRYEFLKNFAVFNEIPCLTMC